MPTQKFASNMIGVEFGESTVCVALADGRLVAAPLGWFPRLRDATGSQQRNWQFIVRGQGIHWPEIDEDIGIQSLCVWFESRVLGRLDRRAALAMTGV